jgi:hypothetical protein
VVAFYNKRGTCEQWIREGKSAIKWTRLSCRTFAANAVRLQLHALAYNLGDFLRTLATPEPQGLVTHKLEGSQVSQVRATMPRWKPMRAEEENDFYRRIDEGVSKYGLTFTRPRTLEERMSLAHQCGRDFYRAQVVKNAGAAAKRSREMFAYRLAFLAGYVGESKRAH